MQEKVTRRQEAEQRVTPLSPREQELTALPGPRKSTAWRDQSVHAAQRQSTRVCPGQACARATGSPRRVTVIQYNIV